MKATYFKLKPLVITLSIIGLSLITIPKSSDAATLSTSQSKTTTQLPTANVDIPGNITINMSATGTTKTGPTAKVSPTKKTGTTTKLATATAPYAPYLKPSGKISPVKTGTKTGSAATKTAPTGKKTLSTKTAGSTTAFTPDKVKLENSLNNVTFNSGKPSDSANPISTYMEHLGNIRGLDSEKYLTDYSGITISHALTTQGLQTMLNTLKLYQKAGTVQVPGSKPAYYVKPKSPFDKITTLSLNNNDFLNTKIINKDFTILKPTLMTKANYVYRSGKPVTEKRTIDGKSMTVYQKKIPVYNYIKQSAKLPTDTSYVTNQFGKVTKLVWHGTNVTTYYETKKMVADRTINDGLNYLLNRIAILSPGIKSLPLENDQIIMGSNISLAKFTALNSVNLSHNPLLNIPQYPTNQINQPIALTIQDNRTPSTAQLKIVNTNNKTKLTVSQGLSLANLDNSAYVELNLQGTYGINLNQKTTAGKASVKALENWRATPGPQNNYRSKVTIVLGAGNPTPVKIRTSTKKSTAPEYYSKGFLQAIAKNSNMVYSFQNIPVSKGAKKASKKPITALQKFLDMKKKYSLNDKNTPFKGTLLINLADVPPGQLSDVEKQYTSLLKTGMFSKVQVNMSNRESSYKYIESSDFLDHIKNAVTIEFGACSSAGSASGKSKPSSKDVCNASATNHQATFDSIRNTVFPKMFKRMSYPKSIIIQKGITKITDSDHSNAAALIGGGASTSSSNAFLYPSSTDCQNTSHHNVTKPGCQTSIVWSAKNSSRSHGQNLSTFVKSISQCSSTGASISHCITKARYSNLANVVPITPSYLQQGTIQPYVAVAQSKKPATTHTSATGTKALIKPKITRTIIKDIPGSINIKVGTSFSSKAIMTAFEKPKTSSSTSSSQAGSIPSSTSKTGKPGSTTHTASSTTGFQPDKTKTGYSLNTVNINGLGTSSHSGDILNYLKTLDHLKTLNRHTYFTKFNQLKINHALDLTSLYSLLDDNADYIKDKLSLVSIKNPVTGESYFVHPENALATITSLAFTNNALTGYGHKYRLDMSISMLANQATSLEHFNLDSNHLVRGNLISLNGFKMLLSASLSNNALLSIPQNTYNKENHPLTLVIQNNAEPSASQIKGINKAYKTDYKANQGLNVANLLNSHYRAFIAQGTYGFDTTGSSGNALRNWKAVPTINNKHSQQVSIVLGAGKKIKAAAKTSSSYYSAAFFQAISQNPNMVYDFQNVEQQKDTSTKTKSASKKTSASLSAAEKYYQTLKKYNSMTLATFKTLSSTKAYIASTTYKKLSTADKTNALQTKLIALQNIHFKGTLLINLAQVPTKDLASAETTYNKLISTGRFTNIQVNLLNRASSKNYLKSSGFLDNLKNHVSSVTIALGKCMDGNTAGDAKSCAGGTDNYHAAFSHIRNTDFPHIEKSINTFSKNKTYPLKAVLQKGFPLLATSNTTAQYNKAIGGQYSINVSPYLATSQCQPTKSSAKSVLPSGCDAGIVWSAPKKNYVKYQSASSYQTSVSTCLTHHGALSACKKIALTKNATIVSTGTKKPLIHTKPVVHKKPPVQKKPAVVTCDAACKLNAAIGGF